MVNMKFLLGNTPMTRGDSSAWTGWLMPARETSSIKNKIDFFVSIALSSMWSWSVLFARDNFYDSTMLIVFLILGSNDISQACRSQDLFSFASFFERGQCRSDTIS